MPAKKIEPKTASKPVLVGQARAALEKAILALEKAETAIEHVDRPPPLKPLKTVEEGIEVLGGTAETARICGISMQSVSGWKTAGYFATDTYLLLRPIFEELGYDATPRLWRMREPA